MQSLSVISSVAFLPEIVLYSLAAKHQQLLEQTQFAATQVLANFCLILSCRVRDLPFALLSFLLDFLPST